MKDWTEEDYSLGDTRSKGERLADREAAVKKSGMSWRATRRLNA